MAVDWGTIAIGVLLTAAPPLFVTLAAALLALASPVMSEKRARQADKALRRLVSLARVLKGKDRKNRRDH